MEADRYLDFFLQLPIDYRRWKKHIKYSLEQAQKEDLAARKKMGEECLCWNVNG